MKQHIPQIKSVIEESHNAQLAAEDILKLRTNEKLLNIEKQIVENEDTLRKYRHTISAETSTEINEKLRVLKEKKCALYDLLANSTDAKRRAVRRIKLSLIESNRIKRRQAGAGPNTKLTPDDEHFISQVIEEHASVDGRRKRDVLYFARRLKQKDLISIMNFRLVQQGRVKIKSAQTIMNRSMPHNKRTLQAKKHRNGQWLFCSKKPPKTALHTRIHTRYQRQARKLAKYHAVTGARKTVSPALFLIISKDDKAYLRPGTTGTCTIIFIFSDSPSIVCLLI